jgi:hypothetical protein
MAEFPLIEVSIVVSATCIGTFVPVAEVAMVWVDLPA